MNKHRIPKASREDIERLEREAKKAKRREYPRIDPLDRKEIKSSMGYSRLGMWGRK